MGLSAACGSRRRRSMRPSSKKRTSPLLARVRYLRSEMVAWPFCEAKNVFLTVIPPHNSNPTLALEPLRVLFPLRVPSTGL